MGVVRTLWIVGEGLGEFHLDPPPWGRLAAMFCEENSIFSSGSARTLMFTGPPATRAQFDALRGPTGALIIGDAEKVAEKILYVNEVLGGLSRITFQMGVSALPHQKMLRSIEILGTRVAPHVRNGFAASTRA